MFTFKFVYVFFKESVCNQNKLISELFISVFNFSNNCHVEFIVVACDGSSLSVEPWGNRSTLQLFKMVAPGKLESEKKEFQNLISVFDGAPSFRRR